MNAKGLRLGIVVSRFNSFITERLLHGALDALARAGAGDKQVEVVRVPGSFEIPVAAKRLAETGRYHALVAFTAGAFALAWLIQRLSFLAGLLAPAVAAAFLARQRLRHSREWIAGLLLVQALLFGSQVIANRSAWYVPEEQAELEQRLASASARLRAAG